MTTGSKLSLFCLLAAVACAPKAPFPPETAQKPAPSAAPASGADAPKALRAAELAEVPSVTFGPYLGVRPDGALVVWASVVSGKRRFNVVPLGPRGRPRAEQRAIADAPDELGLALLRPFNSGHVLLYTARNGSDENLRALCLDAEGKPLGAEQTLGTLSGPALWIDAIATDSGALVLSASRGAKGQRTAEVAAFAVGNGCRSQAPTTLAKDVLAWQAAPLGRGALVAVVRGVKGATPGFGSVEALIIDSTGVERAKVEITKEPSAELDLDASPLGDRVVVGFSDQRGLEPRVVTAVVDANGALAEPLEPLAPGDGEQTLVRLVPSNAGAFVAWENVRASGSTTRRLQLSALDARGRLTGPRAEVDYVSDDGGVPEFVAGPRGLSILTLAPVCPRLGKCGAAKTGPFYVELDSNLAPVTAEPLRLEPLGGRHAELGFGLGCSKQHCFALAALARAPAPVFATELEARSSAWRPPARRLDTSARPRVLEEQALTVTESVADFALASEGGQSYLAHITDFDPNIPWKPLLRPAPDGRFDPLRAKIVFERPAAGLERPAPVPASPVSLRAHSPGGVSVALDPKRGSLLLAWSGMDMSEPQVFLTLVGKDKKREAQRMLTRKKGPVGEIALAWVGDGWVVAWVDGRSGNAEVYAAKVDPRLNRASREQALSTVKGSASDVQLAFDGTTLYVVYADSRSNDATGRADIYARALNPKDAAPAGDELRLSNTPEHSFSPAIAPRTGGFAVAWLERGNDGKNDQLVARPLSASGLGELVNQPLAAGQAGGVGLSCRDAECRLALPIEIQNEREAVLAVAKLDAAGLSPVTRVLDLDGARGVSVAPTIIDDVVTFVSATNDGASIRSARIAW